MEEEEGERKGLNSIADAVFGGDDDDDDIDPKTLLLLCC